MTGTVLHKTPAAVSVPPETKIPFFKQSREVSDLSAEQLLLGAVFSGSSSGGSLDTTQPIRQHRAAPELHLCISGSFHFVLLPPQQHSSHVVSQEQSDA